MFGNGDERAYRAEYNSVSAVAVEEKPEIVQCAQDYEACRRRLQQLQQERDKLEEEIRQTIHRKEEAAGRMVAIIQTPEVEQKYRKQ